MSHLESKIESLTRKWWVLNKQQRAGFDEVGYLDWVYSDGWEKLERDKDKVVELLAELKSDAPAFPVGSQE